MQQAKTKAKQLVDKFYMLSLVDYETAKECALIEVEEIIDLIQSFSDLKSTIFINDKPTAVIGLLHDWLKIKIEIELL